MKKIFTIIAAAAMLAVSCQKETPATDNTGSSSAGGKLTATIAQTKVTYAERGNDLQPAWEVGDKIIGFDDAGSTYTLTVASVEAETATLEGTVPDGALHLIYKSGASASDISAKTLVIDYKNQAGDKTMPAVMLADGTVADGSCDFEFTNAGAIIGISAVNGIPSGSAISKITVEGENLSAATVALSGSALALSATPAATDAISTAALSGITVTDANGTLSTPLYIAVPAGAVIKKVSASVSDKTYSYTLAAAKTAAAREYLYVKTQEFKALPAGALPGKFSVSATKQVYFSQGNLYYDGSKFNFEANQYDFRTYVGKNSCIDGTSSDNGTPTGHWGLFGWSTEGKNYGMNKSIYDTDYSGDFYDWGKAVGDGNTWRTLTTAEWQYLFNYGDYTSDVRNGKYKWATVNGVGGYVIAPDDFTGTLQESYANDAGLADAGNLVFLPAAGGRNGSSVDDVGDYGSYWSSTARDLWFSYLVSFISGDLLPDGDDTRHGGSSVRLVTECQ